MKNSTVSEQSYLQYLPQLLLISFLVLIIQNLYQFPIFRTYQSPLFRPNFEPIPTIRILTELVGILFVSALFWNIVAQIIENKKAALITFLAFALIQIGATYYFSNTSAASSFQEKNFNAHIVITLLNIIPFVLLAFFSKKISFKNVLLITCLYYTQSFTSGISMFIGQMWNNILPEAIGKLFYFRSDTSSDNHFPLDLIAIFYTFCSIFASNTFILGLLNYFILKKELEVKHLDLTNQFTDSQAFMILFSQKIFIILYLFGGAGSLCYYFPTGENKEHALSGYLMFLISAIAFGFGLYLVLWWYRKTFLEWIFSKNTTPSFVYFIAHLPMIGTLALAIFAFISKQNNSVSERITLLENAKPNNGWQLLLGLLIAPQIVATFFFFAKTDTGSGISLLVLIALQIWYFLYKSGYYALFVLCIILGLLGAIISRQLEAKTFAVLLAFISIWYLWLGIFHIDDFTHNIEKENSFEEQIISEN